MKFYTVVLRVLLTVVCVCCVVFSFITNYGHLQFKSVFSTTLRNFNSMDRCVSYKPNKF